MKIERKTGIDPVFCSEFFDIFGELPLDRMFFSHGDEIEEIVRETDKEIFCVYPEMRGNHNVSSMKHPFDYGKWSFNERSRSVDRPISPFVFC